jgi:hypothetical protein
MSCQRILEVLIGKQASYLRVGADTPRRGGWMVDVLSAAGREMVRSGCHLRAERLSKAGPHVTSLFDEVVAGQTRIGVDLGVVEPTVTLDFDRGLLAAGHVAGPYQHATRTIE